jgi:hypothetical protein
MAISERSIGIYLRAARSGIRPWGGPAGDWNLPSRCALRYSPLARPGGRMEFAFALRAPVFDQRPQANIEIAAILPLSRRC